MLVTGNWFRANELSLNVMKTNYILFTSRRKQIPPIEGILKISDVPIPMVSTTKFLGVYLDRYFTWNYHIDQIANKVAENANILHLYLEFHIFYLAGYVLIYIVL